MQVILFRSGLFVLITCTAIDSNVGCLLACLKSGLTQIVKWLSCCVIQETDGIKLRTDCVILCESGGFESGAVRAAVSCVWASRNGVGEQQYLEERNASIFRVC
jgi:hypothetical protein